MNHLSKLLAIAILLIFSNHAHAAAAGGAHVTVDGKDVGGFVETFPDGPIDPAWAGPLLERLKGTALEFEGDIKPIIDPKDANKATLRGKIKVAASFRGRDVGSAETEVVNLEKRGDSWYITPKDMDRLIAEATKKE